MVFGWRWLLPMVAALESSQSQHMEEGDPTILPGQGCFDIDGSLSGTPNHCLYTEQYCCSGACAASGGYWIDGTNPNMLCESDPDCDDADPATICGCDWLSDCGEATSLCSTDVAAVNKACCTDGVDCTSGIPATCSAACAPVYLAFWHSCKALFTGAGSWTSLDSQALSNLVRQCKAVSDSGGGH